MKYQFDIKQKQNLSQNMILSTEILQMSSQELEVYISELAMENPLIDIENLDEPISNYQDIKEKLEWLGQIDENNRVYSKQELDDENNGNIWECIGESEEDNLSRYLHSQIPVNQFNHQEYKIISFIIDNLDLKGYFVESTEEIAKQFNVKNKEIVRLLNFVQSLEPAGIGARNLKQCLILQIDRVQLDSSLTKIIVSEHLELLAKNQIAMIAKKMKVTVPQILSEVDKIKSLNPKPGNSFASRDNLSYIIPDITIVKLKGYYEVLLNEYKYPRISINLYYKNILNEEHSAETKDYVYTKMKQAEWVKKCISQRSTTLIDVAKTIVDIQEEFFFSGRGLKPMRLIDVADMIGIHESTVSRAVREKYLQCTWGVYPMNYFFSKAIEVCTVTGGISVDVIQEKIVKLIDEEDKGKPLSDQKITELLNNDGITISRRTVAKYRNILEIKDASGRKEFMY